MKTLLGKEFTVLVIALIVHGNANAWFIWIPTGAIARAMETDPDSISVSESDRLLAKCAGYHVNQAKKFSVGQSAIPDSPGGPQPESKETTFHATMADLAGEKSADKNKVRDLANAYGTRWSRVAGADLNANRAYGTDLVRGCIRNDIPFRLADYPTWQANQDAKKRTQAEDERKRAEVAQSRLRADEDAKRANETAGSVVRTELTIQRNVSQAQSTDYTSEAKKSARILGCPTDDLRVVGTDGQNILFSASCGTQPTLQLTCDPTGLCLKR